MCHRSRGMDALLGAVWLYAEDVPRTVAFYRDVLELPVVDESHGVGHFDTGNVRLSIHPARPAQPIGSGGFYVFIVDDIEADVERLSGRGVEFVGGITDEPFGRIAEFRDPDGHELSLWQIPREGEPEYEHIEPLARHFAQLRAALGR
jgi:predicted enzyme related to lactoylglutathione lyase